MAVIAGNPYIIQNCLVTLATNDYSALISKAELVPTTPTATFKSVNGVPYNLSGKAGWVLSLDFAQDIDAATSLSNYLFDNEGITVPFTMAPNGGTTKGFKGSVVLAVGNQGGTADQVAASSITLQVVGKPVRL